MSHIPVGRKVVKAVLAVLSFLCLLLSQEKLVIYLTKCQIEESSQSHRLTIIPLLIITDYLIIYLTISYYKWNEMISSKINLSEYVLTNKEIKEDNNILKIKNKLKLN